MSAATKAATAAVPKTKRLGAATEELLLSTAAQLFARHGYDAVSTKQMAAEAGVTIGALYHYFPSKDAVYEAVTRRTFSEKGVLLRQPVAAPTASPEERLTEQVARFVRMIVTDRQFGMLLQRELLDPRLNEPDAFIRQHFGEPVDIMYAVFEELIPHADKEAAFVAVLGLCFGFASLQGIHALAPNVGHTLNTPEAIGRYATGLLLNGLRRPA